MEMAEMAEMADQVELMYLTVGPVVAVVLAVLVFPVMKLMIVDLIFIPKPEPRVILVLMVGELNKGLLNKVVPPGLTAAGSLRPSPAAYLSASYEDPIIKLGKITVCQIIHKREEISCLENRKYPAPLS